MLYKWAADIDSNLPLYAQLADHLRRQIVSGMLESGTKLPGRQKLTVHFNVSKGTVASAIAQLVQEGMVVSYPKSGFVVADGWNKNVPDWRVYIKRAKHKPGVKEFKYWADVGGLTELGVSSDFNISPFVKKPFEKKSSPSA